MIYLLGQIRIWMRTGFWRKLLLLKLAKKREKITICYLKFSPIAIGDK
jgi:hypothetical protein